MIDNEETLALFEAYRRTGDRRVRDRLVEQQFGLARTLARRFRGRGEPADDLLQVASLGLLKAIERYDPARGLQFSTFATPTILGELKRHFRDKAWIVRPPRSLQELHLKMKEAIEDLTHELSAPPGATQIADRVGCSVEQVLEAIGAGGAYNGDSLDRPANGDPSMTLLDALGETDADMDGLFDREEAGRLLNALGERDRRIVVLRFFDGLTQTEIADRVGISQMHVSRLLTRALNTMRGLAGVSAPDDTTSCDAGDLEYA